MLDAPRPRVELLVLHLVLRHDAPVPAKDDAAGAAGALVDARDIGGHVDVARVALVLVLARAKKKA